MAHLEHLKLLVNLARIDGDMAEREKVYITNIGKANGFPDLKEPKQVNTASQQRIEFNAKGVEDGK